MAHSNWIRRPVGIALVAIFGIFPTAQVRTTQPSTTSFEARVLHPSLQAVEETLGFDQMALIDFAVGRFAAQDLGLPEVTFEFFATTAGCEGHKGFYIHASRTLRMCSMDKATMLHELAHAWANVSLTEEKMKAFADYRGLEAWNDKNLAWEDRGTEHAAEIIAWALLDEPNHVRWVEQEPDGSSKVEYRLLRIENSDVDSMLAAFRFLTGSDPVFRGPDEWVEASTTGSGAVAKVDGCADRTLLQRTVAVIGC